MTECGACGQPNLNQSKFCSNCGSALMAAELCPACLKAVIPGHRFCNSCGAQLRKSERQQLTRVGERKQVSVLFADIRNSMGLAQRAGPERWHEVIEPFQNLMASGVHRYEGTVNQFLGDGIMALFGAPIAHEDHAARACHAALYLREELSKLTDELRSRLGLEVTARTGISSGELVVGAIGDDLRMDYTAVGHEVGLAARVEAMAEPGSIWITEHTQRLVKGLFRLTELGAQEVKGSQDPVSLYRLEGATDRTRLQVAQARGLGRFVGRRDEKATISSALERVRQSSGQVVGIIGEPGVGKSRLSDEIVGRCISEGMKVLQAHGMPHARSIAFLPILQLLRGYFGIDHSDTPVSARQKIAGRLLLLDESFRAVLALVFDFLGVPDPDLPPPPADAQVRKRQMQGVLGRLVSARSVRGPAVILLEDLQWMDAGSLGFIEHIVDNVPRTQTLLLVNYRPEFQADWMSRTYFTRLVLLPLVDTEVDELLGDRLGNHPSLAGLSPAIKQRTDGNPFFIEEIIATLVESGALAGEPGKYSATGSAGLGAVPSSVQAVIAARIDRLQEDERQLLRKAAVIGREASGPILRRVAGLPDEKFELALHGLISSEFLVTKSTHPVAEYAFKHPLTQEVAYRSQLGSSREAIHAGVAEAISSYETDRVGELAGLIANHWRRAGQPLEAAKWNRSAAEHSASNDPASAATYWRLVHEQTVSAPAGIHRDELVAAACLGILGLGPLLGVTPDATELFEQAREIAEKSNDTRTLARLYLVYARIKGQDEGDVESGVVLTQKASELAATLGLRGLRLAAAVASSMWPLRMGRLSEALTIVEKQLIETPSDLTLGSEHLGYSPYIWLVAQRGRILTWLGRLEESRRELDRAIRLASDHDQSEVLIWAHEGHCDLALVVGDAVSALAHGRAAHHAADRLGTSLMLITTNYQMGRAELQAGHARMAIATLEKSIEIVDESNLAGWMRPNVLAVLAECHLQLEQFDSALGLAARAAEMSAGSDGDVVIAAHVALSRALRATKASPEKIKQSLTVATNALGEDVAYEPRVCLEWAEYYELIGDNSSRDAELQRARELYEEMGATDRALSLVAT